ncbi:MAG: DUF354 domain-containing protein [Bacteroidales bacterium]|jgi:predicted glycosyltransferase|nr:DUF354 domain-containing protein [Bacteroidales bacterium]
MISRVWFDITNTPQVHFLLAIQKILATRYDSFVYSTRDFSETLGLLRKTVDEEDITIVNSQYRKGIAGKGLSLLSRFNSIRRLGLAYDLSISCGSESAVWTTWMKRRKSIAFGDNDTARQWTYGPFVDYAFFPDAIDRPLLERQGLRGRLWQYPGLKEDIYISYFEPDRYFMDCIPFGNYIVVRPENLHANYLRNGKASSLVPGLLRRLTKAGYKIVYLPRHEEDRALVEGFDNVFIPGEPLNGLDLCYNADAVLTGAGTLAREAACLGVPAISFYAGSSLLAVDRKLIAEGRMSHSRDAGSIVDTLRRSSRQERPLARSAEVRDALAEKLLEVITLFDS